MQYNINISKKVFNKAFIDNVPLESKQRYLILYGGSGSGKSFYIAQRFVYLMLTSTINLLVVRNTGRSNRDSTFALIKQVINKWNLDKLFTINQSDMRIKCQNGNGIIFTGLDDVEKLKSITFDNGELTTIWVEEATEILESDFNQLDIRLRGKGSNKQIVISFNPIDVNHWLKKRFFDKQDDNILIYKSTYKDNQFIDDDYKRLLESYKDTDEYYYNVYCLGNFGVYGKTIFDAKAVSQRLQTITKPLKTGQFIYDYDGNTITNIRWQEDRNGYIKLYYVPNSPRITKYVIGGDTSGEGSDYFIGQVLDAYDGTQVATLRHEFDSDQYSRQMYCLGKYYNDALISIEVNFDTYPIKELQRLGYQNMYVRESQDTYTGATKKAYGFRTDQFSRPRIISQLVEVVRDKTETLHDKDTLDEMLTFVRNEKGRAEAQNGAHDDLIMALAIAHDSIGQVRWDKESIATPFYSGFDLDIYHEYDEDRIEVF